MSNLTPIRTIHTRTADFDVRCDIHRRHNGQFIGLFWVNGHIVPPTLCEYEAIAIAECTDRCIELSTVNEIAH